MFDKQANITAIISRIRTALVALDDGTMPADEIRDNIHNSLVTNGDVSEQLFYLCFRAAEIGNRQ